MSHGDANVPMVKEGGCSSQGKPGADDFGRAVSKIVVAQICESVGFQSSKESALDSLADIAIRYLCDLGKMANFYANLTGRTECNVFDIIRALEVLELTQGFPGAGDVSHCLVSSGTVKELVAYVDSAPEIPFAQPLPRFPVTKIRKPVPSFEKMGENPPGQHIPSWLPAFPDPHTYIQSPMWNERNTDPRSDKIEQARQRRKAERSLLNLQQRLLCNGAVGSGSTSVLPENAENGSHKVENNPFLDSPLPPGEKDVSAVALPRKLSVEAERGNQVSVVEAERGSQASVAEAFAPAIEAVKNGFCENGEEEEDEDVRKVLPDTRPTVHFKFRTAKKFLGESLDLNLQKKGDGRPSNWFSRDEERDDKKRRAEYILRQSMENPQELTQL